MGVGILSKKLFTKLCIWCEAVGGGGAGGGSDWLILNFGGGCFQFY